MSNKYNPVIYVVSFAIGFVGFIGSSLICRYINENKCSKSSKDGHISSNRKMQSTIAKIHNKLDKLSTELNELNAEIDSWCSDLDNDEDVTAYNTDNNETNEFTDDCEMDFEEESCESFLESLLTDL